MIENGKKTSVAKILGDEYEEFFGGPKEISIPMTDDQILAEAEKLSPEQSERYLQIAQSIRKR